MEKITSLQNSRIKNVIRLRKSSERTKQNIFSIEGLNEINHALHNDYIIDTLFYCPEIAPDEVTQELLSKSRIAFEVSKDVFSKMAYREDSGGVLVLSNQKSHHLSDIKLSQNPLIIVLESVEKPGNLGAILRTADSAGVDAVMLCDPSTDIYNPNVIRGSVGCLFSTQVATCTSEEAMVWLKTNQLRTFATHIETNKWYHESDYKGPSAIVMGTESTGLTKRWITFADEGIKIPMLGVNDSLNVSIATAVVVYEAARQRNFNF
ncbi:MAG: RNA methyltransferase [Bacteroidales bacterium]|nr:RNA methyltransferase [Bacteroidales bacterium]